MMMNLSSQIQFCVGLLACSESHMQCVSVGVRQAVITVCYSVSSEQNKVRGGRCSKRRDAFVAALFFSLSDY